MPTAPRKIAVLTTEPLPLPGCAPTGAGLRAWGLAAGLASRGFDVVIGSPAVTADAADASASRIRAAAMPRNSIGAFLDREAPSAVVLQHWGLAMDVPELSVPLALDLAGPHLLERLYWGGGDFQRDLGEKLDALRRADFVVCSGEFQRRYFLPFLMQAGFDLRCRDPLPVIPFSVPPAGDFPGTWDDPLPDGPRFVYGGAFLAWQDPSAPLTWLLEEMDRAGRGSLVFVGGSHPVIDASGGKFADLSARLEAHPRVRRMGFLPFDRLMALYRACDVAVDLMARNPERELAYTTRTMVYLACGLPVIHNDFSEVAGVISRNRCGWTLDPDNGAAFRDAVRSVLDGTAPLAAMRAGALAGAADHAWDRTIGPLADFCAAPREREGRRAIALAASVRTRESDSLRAERDEAVRRLRTLEGKFLVRLQKRLPGFAPVLAPLAWLASWPVALWVWLRLRGGGRGRARV